MKKLFAIIWITVLSGTCILQAQTPITVIETNFKLAIMGEEFFHFGFAGGDQLIFSFAEQNGKDLKEIEILEMPATSIFKDFKIGNIQNKIITVPRTGIYQFHFVNSVMLQKTCSLKIQRIAASEATRNFNSTVYWRTVYDTTYRTSQQQPVVTPPKAVSILPPTTHYLEPNAPNSTPQIILPVTLPDFTSEWYYVFIVNREKAPAEAAQSTIQLAETIQKKLAGGMSAIHADSLPAPAAGTAGCRIYLLDKNNQELFENKGAFRHFKEGTRENLSAGLVKIKTAHFTNAFLGIRNPNADGGIYITLEAVAVVAPDASALPAEVQSVSIKARKEAYLKN